MKKVLILIFLLITLWMSHSFANSDWKIYKLWWTFYLYQDQIWTTGENLMWDFVLTWATLKNFKFIKWCYAKINNNLYCANNVIAGVDIKTFKAYNNPYAKDKNHVYFRENMIIGADWKTFNALSKVYSKDKNHVYYYWKILEWADTKTFKVLVDWYFSATIWIDKKNVFKDDKIIDFDVKTFKTKGEYIYDKNKVECFWQYTGSISAVDIKTFQVIWWSKAKDKNHTYNSCSAK